MEMIACQCDGLPPHDHFMGYETQNNTLTGKYDSQDVGRVWVPWKAIAHALIASRDVDEQTERVANLILERLAAKHSYIDIEGYRGKGTPFHRENEPDDDYTRNDAWWEEIAVTAAETAIEALTPRSGASPG